MSPAERASEASSAEQANERTDERVGQILGCSALTVHSPFENHQVVVVCRLSHDRKGCYSSNVIIAVVVVVPVVLVVVPVVLVVVVVVLVVLVLNVVAVVVVVIVVVVLVVVVLVVVVFFPYSFLFPFLHLSFFLLLGLVVNEFI